MLASKLSFPSKKKGLVSGLPRTPDSRGWTYKLAAIVICKLLEANLRNTLSNTFTLVQLQNYDHSKVKSLAPSGSSLVGASEQLDRTNIQTILESLQACVESTYCYFINTTAYYLGRYWCSSPSPKEVHGHI